MRRYAKTGRPWEEQCGFSRAVRVGNLIETSLTSPASESGAILFPGDVYRQTLVCLDIIKAAITELGGTLDQVFRTRIYLADPSRWAEAGRAHKEVFGDTRRTLGWIYMSGFFNPDIAVEVECSALCEPEA
jgi:enamine deaminase RidA (YjgF/YER057c/UK114 family)